MDGLQNQLWLAGAAMALAGYVFNTFPQRAEIDRIYVQLDRIENTLLELKGSKESKPESAHKPNKAKNNSSEIK